MTISKGTYSMELIIEKIVRNNEKEFVLLKVEEDCNLWPY